MSLHSLPYGTITKVLKQIALEQGKEFRDTSKGHAQYDTRCIGHDKRKASLSVNDQDNVWNCHYGCGKGGVIHAVLRLHPHVAMDRPSALKWLADRKLIPPPDPTLAVDFETAYQQALQRLCTHNGIEYPSTAAVRNKARSIVAPRYERFPELESEPWNEPAQPWVASDPDWQGGYAQALHEIAQLCEMEPARLEAAAPHSSTIANLILVRADLLAQRPGYPFEDLSELQALAIAWFARNITQPQQQPPWLLPYVRAHAAWLRDPHGSHRSSAWFGFPDRPTPNRRYLAYHHALTLVALRQQRPWHVVEREVHHRPQRQRQLRAWIDAKTGTARAS